MRTTVIVGAIGLVLVFLGIGWAAIERWIDGHAARRRRGLEVDPAARAYLRATSGRMSEEHRRAIQEAQARAGKREG